MITNILLTKGYERGYLPKSDSAMIQPIFATANLAVRRKALDEIGPFDINCKTGEDIELGIRLSRTKWELFFEPRAVIKHKHRTSVGQLLRQWYGYGQYHPYIFKKHTSKCIKIYFPKNKEPGWSYLRFSRIFGLPVPFHVSIFIMPFHILNVFLALALFSAVLKLTWLSIFALAAWLASWLYFSGRDFFENVILKRNPRWVVYSALRYIVNWAYVCGAFIAGLRIGVIYLDVTRENTPSV